MRPPRRKRIVFVVTEDWAFLSHRLPMARAACELGLEVVVATRVSRHRETIEAMGFRVAPVPFRRRNTNPLTELAVVWRLLRIFWRERPAIVHNVSLKPILDGSLAALAAPRCKVVNTFTGLGAIFIGDERHGALRRRLLPLFRLLLARRAAWAIVQNADDARSLRALGIIRESRTAMIHGSGIDLAAFPMQPEPAAPVTATMVCRLLWDKGIGEMVDAARHLKQEGTDVRVVVVGDADPDNPNSVDPETLAAWRAEGVVDFQGRRDDIAVVWASAHIAVLPSYREGLPKSLLEAAATGRPMVAADVPGCRELVRDGENGLLVPARDGAALAAAIRRLAADQALRLRLGAAARTTVEERYADSVVVAATTALYRRLVASHAAGGPAV